MCLTFARKNKCQQETPAEVSIKADSAQRGLDADKRAYFAFLPNFEFMLRCFLQSGRRHCTPPHTNIIVDPRTPMVWNNTE